MSSFPSCSSLSTKCPNRFLMSCSCPCRRRTSSPTPHVVLLHPRHVILLCLATEFLLPQPLHWWGPTSHPSWVSHSVAAQGLNPVDCYPTADSKSSPPFCQRQACQVLCLVTVTGLGRQRPQAWATKLGLVVPVGNSFLFLFPNRFQTNFNPNFD
jgi:hypothetical protein